MTEAASGMAFAKRDAKLVAILECQGDVAIDKARLHQADGTGKPAPRRLP